MRPSEPGNLMELTKRWLENRLRSSDKAAEYAKAGQEQVEDVFEREILVDDVHLLGDNVAFDYIIGQDITDEVIDAEFTLARKPTRPGTLADELNRSSGLGSGELVQYDGDSFSTITATSIVSGYLLADGTVLMAGDLRPDTDNTYNLGESARRFATVFATSVNAGASSLVLNGTRISASTLAIEDVADPTNPQDAATLAWVLATALIQSQNLADLDDVPTARTNLGLGTAALDDTGDFEPSGAVGTHAGITFGVHGISAFGSTLTTAVSQAAGRTALGLGDSAVADVGTGSGDVAAGDDARFIETRFHPWARPIVKAEWFSSQFNGWGGAFAGGGASYIAQSRFFGANFDTRIVTVATVDTAAGTSGTIGACRFTNDSGRIGVSNGYVIAFNTSVVNLSEIQACRIGFFGDAATPAATGRHTAGCWLEFDRSVSTTDWNLTCGASSTYTAQGTSSAVPSATWEWWAIVYESSSSVKLYGLGTSSATLLATVTTNIPSTTQQRTGGVFFQVEKTNPATSARAHLQNDLFCVIPDEDRYLVLP